MIRDETRKPTEGGSPCARRGRPLLPGAPGGAGGLRRRRDGALRGARGRRLRARPAETDSEDNFCGNLCQFFLPHLRGRASKIWPSSAENEPPKVRWIFELWGGIFADPHRPRSRFGGLQDRRDAVGRAVAATLLLVEFEACEP